MSEQENPDGLRRASYFHCDDCVICYRTDYCVANGIRRKQVRPENTATQGEP